MSLVQRTRTLKIWEISSAPKRFVLVRFLISICYLPAYYSFCLLIILIMSETLQNSDPVPATLETPAPNDEPSAFSSPIKNSAEESAKAQSGKDEGVAATAHSISESSPPQAANLEQKLQKYFDQYDVLEVRPSQKGLHKVETPVLGLAGVESGKSDGSDDRDMDEEELYRYSQLSSKLNSALSKIQHSHFLNVKSPKREGFDQTYKRFEMLEKKRKDQIDRRAKELEEEKLKQLKLKPAVNEHSLHLQRNNQPIYQRYGKQLERKAKKLQDQIDKKKKHEEEQYQQYLKVFEEKNHKPDKFRTTEEFYSELVRWKQKIHERVQEKKATEKEKEIQGITFQPIINERSKKLLKKTEWQPIYEREPKPPKPIVQQYSFKPKINKKVPKS